MTEAKQNIRYLGFETQADGSRRFAFTITAAGKSSTRVSMDIPGGMFTGNQKITFQESARICYEKLRLMLQSDMTIPGFLQICLTVDDIQQLRHVPRGRPRFPNA
jgi:hypothetical protein